MAAEKKPTKPSPSKIPGKKGVPVRPHRRSIPATKPQIEPPQPWPRKGS